MGSQIHYYHSTPTKEHYEAYRTYHRLKYNLYWYGITKSIQKFIASYLVHQCPKYEAMQLADIL